MKITDKIIQNHGLKLDEFKNIQRLLKRDPNLLELVLHLIKVSSMMLQLPMFLVKLLTDLVLVLLSQVMWDLLQQLT